MRVFVALTSADLLSCTLDDAILNYAHGQLHEPADRHMTLSFLGELSEQQVKAVSHQLDEAYSEGLLKAVSWSVDTIANFPKDNPKVWAMLGELPEDLDELANVVRSLVEDMHSQYRFKPHVSLAYLKGASGVNLKYRQDIGFDGLELFRSLTQKERKGLDSNEGYATKRYETIKRWQLK